MTDPRTQAQAVAEVRFGIEYAALNERLWQHLDTGLNLLQIGLGALALAGALATLGAVAGASGGVLAVVGALQLTLQPVRRSIAFRDARFEFHELNKRAWALPLEDLDAALEDLRKCAPQGMQALLRPAQQRVELQHGHTDRLLRLSWRERLAAALA